jgi:hypothetical protein
MSGTVNNGLAVGDVVNISVSLTPTGAASRNFGNAMAIGGSNVIPIGQRYRNYTSMTAVALDYGASTPEYQAALAFYSAQPTPTNFTIGAWAKTAQPAVLIGGPLSAAQQLISNFNGITTGSFQITFQAGNLIVSNLNFSSATNLNAVAAIIQANALLTTVATVAWVPSLSAFKITTIATGAAATITPASASGSGTDVSGLLGLTVGAAATASQGMALETPLAALTALEALSNAWYMVGFADTSVTDVQHQANAAFIEAQTPSRVYGFTTQEAGALVSSSTTDLAYLMQQAGYTRTTGQYSSTSPYAVFAKFGRFATIAYGTGSNVAITAKFQTEPGIVAEYLSESQAASLAAKNCDVFVNYQNGVAILQQGVMSSGLFFDIRQSADWLQNQAQTDIFNALITAGTKIPQTDAGMNVLTTTFANTLAQAVNNGMLAPGVWNAPGFGSLAQGQFLTAGYYIYTPTINSQTEAVRQTRQAPLMQAAVKLAGAIHFANAAISINQ